MQFAEPTGKIQNISSEPNIQWYYISKVKEVDHLHCSFLYRSNIVDYNLGLSRVAHREETLFTYGLKQKGYNILVIPCVTWHLKNREGGIRTGTQDMFAADEQIFQNMMGMSKEQKTVVVMNNGMGDHLVFTKVLQDIPNPVCYTCYPEIIPGKSIAEAEKMFGSLDQWDIYRKMDEWHWKDSLENAFRKMYGVEKK